jgi:RNA polymerase sigma-70 factor (ECF subfamily)
MANGQLLDVLRNLRRTALHANGAEATDGELLECYLAQRDQSAFELLLHRHGPMVLGVCRRLLRNEADAHDAFQATFLVFVRKAHCIVPRGQVGNWLYGVAQKTALKARHLNRQRLVKERQAPVPIPIASTAGDDGQELLVLIDGALGRLPVKYRSALVLCCLEQVPLREAARQLGCPQGTLASRLARGRALLVKRMARLGLSVTSVSLTAAFSQMATQASVPAPLMASTTHSALAATTAEALAAGLISSQAVALAEAVAHGLAIAKGKLALAAVVATLLLGGALLVAPSYQAGGDDAANPTQPSGSEPARRAVVSDREALQGTWIAISIERDGKKLGEIELKRWGDLTFADDRVERGGVEPRSGSYVLHSDRRPKQIVLFADENGWHATYELSGNQLKLRLQTGARRGEEFESKDTTVMVFEKQSPTRKSMDKSRRVGERE